jgi:hypothetical protein
MPGIMDKTMKNREGAVIVIVAICLVVIVGMAAFAIDTGMLFSARSDAQRAADAAALAAASAYFDASTPADIEALAIERGSDFGTRNDMLRTPIDAGEVTIQMVENPPGGLMRVRATVRREKVPTFFAGIWGIRDLPVAATAEAEIINALSAECLKPFALPDEVFGPGAGYQYGQLTNIWVSGGEDHVLVGYNDNEPPGLGNIAPYISEKCLSGQTAAMGDGLLWETPGNVVDGQGGDGHGRVQKGMNDLLKDNPPLTWDAVNGKFVEEDWASSGRVGNVVLYDRDSKSAGTARVRVVNFARVYFHRGFMDKGTYTVEGRIFPADGLSSECSGAACAPNAFTIRLVK